MTAEEFLHELRSDPETRLIPVIFLSGSPDDGETQLSVLMAGADDFLSKPFKPKELLLRSNLHMQMCKKRSKLETLFAQREQEIAVLSDYCPTGIMRANDSGFLTYANAAFREMAGIDMNEVVTEWTDYVDEEIASRIIPLWADTVAGSRRTTHAEWKWRNGRIMSGVFIRLDQIRPGMTGIIGCVTDITYQEEKLLEAERRRIEAEESKHQQELLIDLTSHEIRTPVSAILHCSSIVMENLV
jgi:PAS domain-containing protein